MSFADDLRKSANEEQEFERKKELLKRERRKVSLELLKDYVVDLVKTATEEAAQEGARGLQLVPVFHCKSKWGTMSSEIGCFHTTNYSYEQKTAKEQEYSGALDFFVHFNDFEYFSEMVKFELRRCGFNKIKVGFVKHYEKDENLIFKGRFKYHRLQVKVSW